MRESFGAYSLSAISPDLVAKYRDDRLGEGKSNNTVRLKLALLSHLYAIAIQEWKLELAYNPVSAVRKPSPGGGRNRRLTPDEERRFLFECDRHSNPMLGWMVRTALHTGMRAGEIQTLTRDQVDLFRRVVHPAKTKNGRARTVPLTRAAVSVFREALDYPVRPQVTNLVFWGEPGRDGHRRGYEFGANWRRRLQRARIKDFHSHDLRHEAVSGLLEMGLSDQEVVSISGHKSMQMLRRYTHLRTEDLVEKPGQAYLRAR